MNYHIYYNKTSGKKVQTIARAIAQPSMQEVVCYQELYNEYDFFVMSREDFQEQFARELEGIPAYPRAEIEKREEISQKTKRIETKKSEEEDDNSLLSRVLDADTYTEKIEILRKEREKLDERTLNNIAVCMDLSIDEGVDSYEYIMQHLELQRRYEGSRLR